MKTTTDITKKFMSELWAKNEIESIARDSYYEKGNDEDLRITVEMIDIFEAAQNQCANLLANTTDYVSLIFQDAQGNYFIQIERHDAESYPNGFEHVLFLFN